jgi:hypothetical protein
MTNLALRFGCAGLPSADFLNRLPCRRCCSERFPQQVPPLRLLRCAPVGMTGFEGLLDGKEFGCVRQLPYW